MAILGLRNASETVEQHHNNAPKTFNQWRTSSPWCVHPLWVATWRPLTPDSATKFGTYAMSSKVTIFKEYSCKIIYQASRPQYHHQLALNFLVEYTDHDVNTDSSSLAVYTAVYTATGSIRLHSGLLNLPWNLVLDYLVLGTMVYSCVHTLECMSTMMVSWQTVYSTDDQIYAH